MKRFLLILCCLCAYYSYAQQGTLKGDVDAGNFPEVSFVWNEYNPNILAAGHFKLSEDGRDVAFTSDNIPPTEIPAKNKTVLFLWEDVQARKDQFNFTQQLLYYFFAEDLADDTTTMFSIAVFSHKQGDDPVLSLKMPAFTSDKEALKDFITKYDDNARKARLAKTGASASGKQKQSNQLVSVLKEIADIMTASDSHLFMAIREGLELISRESRDNVRAIFVITAGRNLGSEGVEISPVISNALQNRIPVYVVYYPAFENISEAANRLYKETYGELIYSDGIIKEQAKTTRTALLRSFNQLNLRHYGQDYRFTFHSKLPTDNRLHQLVLNSYGDNYNLSPYRTPAATFVSLVKQYWIWFLAGFVAFVAATVVSIIFGRKALKKREDRKMAIAQQQEKQKAQQQAEQENLRRNLQATHEELQRYQILSEQEKKNALDREQDIRLTQLMRTKNIAPRLVKVNDGTTFKLSQATTTIGREADNDIVLAWPTVSKHHAQICFNGVSFEILDLASSNGIIVNGNFVESAELRGSDVIKLGEVYLKFFL